LQYLLVFVEVVTNHDDRYCKYFVNRLIVLLFQGLY